MVVPPVGSSNQLLLIQNGEHLSSVGASLSAAQATGAHADLVLHLRGKRKIRAHRLVLASVSEFFAAVLKDGPQGDAEEREVQLSLPELDFEAVKIVVDFAYKGEAK